MGGNGVERKTLIQAFILGLGQVTGKILSLVFLYRFSKDLGNTGLSLYTYAYIPFSIFSDLSTFGLIPGTSKAVSKLIAENEKKKAYYLLTKGTLLCVFIGVFFFLFMLFFSRQILSISVFDDIDNYTFEQIRINLLLASLSLFIMPLIQFFKGFLQGFMKMYPTAFSIIIEHVITLVLYIILIRSFVDFNEIIHLVFLIYLVGHLFSFVFLLFFVYKYFKQPKERFECYKYLYKIAIPYGITTMFFTIYQLVDSITLSVLMPIEGYYTAYMFETIRLIFLPIALAQSLAGTLNPKINYLFQKNKKEEALIITRKSTSLIISVLIPIVFIMKYFANDIYNLFYSQENGAIILYHISDLILFFGLYKVLIGISLGLPKSNYIIIATIISGIAKYILNYLFIPRFSYEGAIYATIIAVSICILVSYFILHKEGLYLFLANIKDMILATIASFISLFLVILFRIIFYLGSYPKMVGVLLYSVLILSLYYLLKMFFNNINKKIA